MARIYLELTTENRRTLELIAKKGTNWRERERAQTLLLLDDGLVPEQVAKQLDIHVRTVGTTRNLWLTDGLDSLPDRPRSGAPRKLTQEHIDCIVEWALIEPLSAPALLAKLKASGGPQVHLNTLNAALKAAGLVWRRAKHSGRGDSSETRHSSGKLSDRASHEDRDQMQERWCWLTPVKRSSCGIVRSKSADLSKKEMSVM